ncbi:MAG: bifunctional (p)ppGpp synthetase/guanosine-3',5'-bis(diphosphate) 3'-pyrophosphohydrolase [Chloroflexi bacterium]|nr:bifunctional (p)ppGpp synthetase/guanosine-3',5'-bis(diphosphate) 3'-pyrophosphohydrolase [Chloroflexota bacterium]
MPTLFDAIEFAARAHSGQYRKGTRVPYIIHPLAVARTLIECDADETLVIAALLHDVVEDTNTPLDAVRDAFGDEVAELVKALSEPHRQDPWEKRKQGTLEFLATASQEVLMLEVADKLDSLRDIRATLEREGEKTWQRFNRGRDQQAWYHRALAEIFTRRLATECGILLAREFDAHVRAVFGEYPASGLESG